MRCFIAIDIPRKIKLKIKEIQDKLPEFIGKKIEFENLHLTLKFLGEVSLDNIEKIKERLGKIKIKKFEAEIDFIGVFSEREIRIIWMRVKNLASLQKEIDNSLKDLFEKEKRFMEHLTIARIKNIEDKKEFLENLKRIKIEKLNFLVDNFRLKESILKREKPTYLDKETFLLI